MLIVNKFCGKDNDLSCFLQENGKTFDEKW